jgi:hypothetical protein
MNIEEERLLSYFSWNSCTSEERKLFYVATPKVACTSLKWWFAELEGVADVVQQLKISAETDPELIIHDSLKRVAPQLFIHTPEQLEQIKGSEYFSFALVRNPYKRIFSAWQSKILLRETLQIQPYEGQAFVEFTVTSMSDVATAFEYFLEYVYTYESEDFKDCHWTPQYDLLQPELFDYSSISKIEDTKSLNIQLRSFLGGAYIDPFIRAKANESLIPYLPEFISSRSKELIDKLYAKDFDAFRYKTELPPAKETFSQAQLDLAMKGIKLLQGRHQRIGEMQRHHDAQMHELLDRTNAQMHALLSESNTRIHGLMDEKSWLEEQRQAWMTACAEKEERLLVLENYLSEKDKIGTGK